MRINCFVALKMRHRNKSKIIPVKRPVFGYLIIVREGERSRALREQHQSRKPLIRVLRRINISRKLSLSFRASILFQARTRERERSVQLARQIRTADDIYAKNPRKSKQPRQRTRPSDRSFKRTLPTSKSDKTSDNVCWPNLCHWRRHATNAEINRVQTNSKEGSALCQPYDCRTSTLTRALRSDRPNNNPLGPRATRSVSQQRLEQVQTRQSRVRRNESPCIYSAFARRAFERNREDRAKKMPRHYVDNAMNRSLGRVGLPHGSAVHSRSDASSCSSSSSQSGRTYVDNAMNRSLGRVGLQHGSAVRSKTSQDSYSSTSTYVDNELNRRLGRVGLEKGTAVYSRSETSASNPYNGKLGRVGSPPTAPPSSNAWAQGKTYVDNALNRRLGRVGKPLGSCPVSKVKCDPKDFDLNTDDYECSGARRGTYENYSDTLSQEIERLINLKQARRDAAANKSQRIALKAEQIIRFDELALSDKIGGGGFGNVHIALWKDQQVAVKKLRVQRVGQAKKKQFEDEVKSITALNHPNIVKCYGACVVTPNLALVMEFLPDGSLYDNLYYTEMQFEEKTKDQFVCDYFSALEYVHSKNIVHRDLKSKNILLCDEKTHCKLSDFGLALKDDTETEASSKDFGFAGTEKYCPKELIEGNRLTIEQLKLVDVYSLALTTLELLTEKEPFAECTNIHQIRKAIVSGDILRTLANGDLGVSPEKRDLLKSALSQNRPSAAAFLARFNQIVERKSC